MVSKKFNSFLILSIFAISLLCVIGVNAVVVENGVNFILPTNGQSISQNMTIQIVNVTSVFNQINNCTLYIKSPSTANSSWVDMGTFLNTTLSYVNGTYNTTYLEDSNDYTLNATCRNQSNDIGYKTITITVDNTIPIAPSSLSPANNEVISTSGSQTFSSTVTNSKTTSCTYTIARGGATSGNDYTSGTATYSASTCSFTKTFTDSNDNGEWYWKITASDGTNTTNSATNIVSAQFAGGGGGLPGTPTQDDQATCQSLGSNYVWSNGVCYMVNSNPNSQSNNLIWWIIGIIIAIVVVVFIAKSVK